jgi:hypothetical protein
MLASEIQERKNKRSLLVFFTLLIVTIGTFFLVRESNKPSVDKNVFRNVDLEAVNHVQILNSSDTVELQFQNSRWTLNQQLPADRKLVTLLFATLKQTEPKREINAEVADSVTKYFNAGSIHVTLYTDDKAAQRFVVAGNPNKTQTFFKDPTSGKIYLMSIPGYRVYVGGIFEMDSQAWRDKFVLGSFNWRNFAKLDASFPAKPGENFTARVDGPGVLTVEGVKTDTAKLNAFLYDLSVLTVEEYISSNKIRDSLLQAKPFMTMIISDIGNRQEMIKVFREDKNRVLGLIMDNEAVVFDPQKIRSLIRPKSFFSLK